VSVIELAARVWERLKYEAGFLAVLWVWIRRWKR